MRKINVDIKGGRFTTYPSNEVLDYIEGYVQKAYYKQVGTTLQLKVVIIDENIEYTINIITGNVTYQSLVTELINNTGKVLLKTEPHYNSEGREYYLVKNFQ